MYGTLHYKPDVAFSSGLSYHNHSYIINKPYQIASAHYLQLPLEMHYQPQSWGGSQILGGLNVGMPLSDYDVVLDESVVSDSSIVFSSSNISPKWAIGIYAGIGFDIGDNFNLAFTYHRQFSSVYTQTHHEGRPHYVQAALSFDFSKVIKSWTSPLSFSDASSIKQNGVVVVLPYGLFDDSLSREMGIHHIRTAFDSVYRFSDYRFEPDSATSDSAAYYIYFGKLFAKGTETAKNGLYTFNTDLEALKENYYYTFYNQFTNDDFQNLKDVVKMVQTYQMQLDEAYEEYLIRLDRTK